MACDISHDIVNCCYLMPMASYLFISKYSAQFRKCEFSAALDVQIVDYLSSHSSSRLDIQRRRSFSRLTRAVRKFIFRMSQTKKFDEIYFSGIILYTPYYCKFITKCFVGEISRNLAIVHFAKLYDILGAKFHLFCYYI